MLNSPQDCLECVGGVLLSKGPLHRSSYTFAYNIGAPDGGKDLFFPVRKIISRIPWNFLVLFCIPYDVCSI